MPDAGRPLMESSGPGCSGCARKLLQPTEMAFKTLAPFQLQVCTTKCTTQAHVAAAAMQAHSLMKTVMVGLLLFNMSKHTYDLHACSSNRPHACAGDNECHDSDDVDDGDDTCGSPLASQLLSGEASQSEVRPQLLPDELPGVLQIIK